MGGWAVLSAAGMLALSPAIAQAETLADAIALAYQTNPTLQSERAQLRALNESYVQARAGFRPQVSGSAEYDYSKSPSTYETEVDNASATLSVTQPIYTGGLVTAQVRAAMADILSGRQKLRQTEAQVMQQVILAYVDVRRDQEALRIAQDNVSVLNRQLDETKARFDVGQITRTDVAQSEARLAQAQAQLANAMAQLGVSRAGYVAVIGQSPGELAQEPELTAVPATIDEAFAIADKNNGGILAADFAEQGAAARVAEAKSANRPTVSIRAGIGASSTLQESKSLSFGLVKLGVYQENVTASAVLTQPLFTGGLNSSRIREALEDENVQRIAIETARRTAVQQVSQAWNQLLAARAGAVSNQKQVDADQVAWEGTRQEAQVGLRTTLDVLNAEQELHNAQLALVNSKHDQYVASAGLLNAMGRLEVKYLDASIKPYDPEKAFNRVKGGGALPLDIPISTIDGLGSPHVSKPPPQGPMVTAAPVTAPPSAPAQAGSTVMP
ncbi:TolC family outer membrane protein [Phenylobacterium montanum]|nr:TolC family outer membrane protein [Caulobacter sp. S6]